MPFLRQVVAALTVVYLVTGERPYCCFFLKRQTMAAEMAVYFPGIDHGVTVSTEKISPNADVPVPGAGWLGGKVPAGFVRCKPPLSYLMAAFRH